MLPAAVQAQFNYTTNNGAITITGYVGTNAVVIVPDWTNGYPVTAIGSTTFTARNNLTSISIGTNVTSIGIRLLYRSYSVTAITVDTNNRAYSSVAGVLFNKSQTTLIEYPLGKAGSYTIPNSVTSIERLAFEDCPRLTNVTIPSSVTSIGNAAFDQCSGLTSVTLPDSITSIPESAFCNCTGLRSVSIPNSVTSIGVAAFLNCASLTSVTLPDSVTSLDSYAFCSCHSLTTIALGTGVTSLADWVFADCPSLASVCFLGNCPSHNWPVFEDSSQAIVYYLPWTTGWPAPGTSFGGRPTALWLPQTQTSDGSFGMQSNQFGFNITWASDTVVVVEACTDLANPAWIPVGTNTLTGGSSYFSDSQWTNYPNRFYRLHSP